MIQIAELVPKHHGRTKKQESAPSSSAGGSSKNTKGGKKKKWWQYHCVVFFPVRPHTKLLWKLSFWGLKIIVTFGGIFFLLVNWIWTCFMLLMILLQNLLKCLTYKYWVSCGFLALSSNWHGRSGCKDAVSYWPSYVGLCLIHMVLLWWPSLDFDWCHWRCTSNSDLSHRFCYIYLSK